MAAHPVYQMDCWYLSGMPCGSIPGFPNGLIVTEPPAGTVDAADAAAGCPIGVTGLLAGCSFGLVDAGTGVPPCRISFSRPMRSGASLDFFEPKVDKTAGLRTRQWFTETFGLCGRQLGKFRAVVQFIIFNIIVQIILGLVDETVFKGDAGIRWFSRCECRCA